jgi:dipeptidyl aminopeptidase/acylaminoacyl peptidase
MNADGSNQRVVASGVNFDWSPDGKHLVVIRPGFTLHVVPVDGRRARRIGRGSQADWSPDGTKLAFVRGDAVHVIGADGKGLRRLTSPSDAASDSEPVWSPDGRRIAWVRKFESLDSEVNRAFVMNADGTRQRRITTTADPYSVSWSPDGRLLLCSCWVGNNYDIVVIPADGSRVRSLTPEYANDSDPSWSPDGKLVVFTRQDGPGADTEIHAIGRGGSGRKQLTRAPGDAAWSPDGRRLAFISERDGSLGIYVMSADGRRPMNLTHHDGGARTPPGGPRVSTAAVTPRPACAWIECDGGASNEARRHRPSTQRTRSCGGCVVTPSRLRVRARTRGHGFGDERGGWLGGFDSLSTVRRRGPAVDDLVFQEQPVVDRGEGRVRVVAVVR